MTNDPRPYCYRCSKPLATCVCATVQRITNRTRITLLQHPREQRHPLGTARFAELGLTGVRVLVDVAGRYRGSVSPVPIAGKTAVLFPAPGALPLPKPDATEAPDHLIVLDGTWHQAKTLYRDMKWLGAFPHYVLEPDTPSRYRIRKEPKHSYISTLEAILLALRHLEPNLDGFEALLLAFDAMIDRQVEWETHSESQRLRFVRRDVSHQRKPRALAERFRDLVLLYAETSPVNSEGDRQVSYFCAHRLRDDTLFERWIVSPNGVLPQKTLEATVAGGRATADQFVDLQTFEQQLSAFVVAEDHFAGWGPGSLSLLAGEHLRPAGRAVSLKAAYGSFRPGQGALETIVEREGLTPRAPAVPGRGGRRLAHARALAEFIHGRVERPSLE